MTSDVTSNDPTPSPAAATTRYRRGPHWIALFAAVFTLPLLYVGGSVTTYRVGLAVPDWPQTFGINMFLYDFWNAPFGVRVEHMHRLYGAAVGLATLLLAGWFLIFEPRRFLKALSLLAVVLVITQGVLGGTRVTQVSTPLAAVHGVVGQLFFGLMVVLCVLTGRVWRNQRRLASDGGHLRARTAGLLGLVVVQIAIGSWLRHFGERPALAIHAALALAIWGHALFVLILIWRDRGRLRALLASSTAAAAAATLQIALGVAAMIYLWPFDGLPRRGDFLPGCRANRASNEWCAVVGRGGCAYIENVPPVRGGVGGRHVRGKHGHETTGGGGCPGLGGGCLKSMASIDQPLLVTSPSEDMLSAIGARLSAYISLTKPRLVLLVLVTVAVGFVLGSRAVTSPASIISLGFTLVGTALVAGGAGAINQWLERDHDALMRRTANRALPSGRLAPSEAAVFGVLLTLMGAGLLVLGANMLAAAIAVVTFILYAFVYTPLKPLTTLNTVVGAVPGALPPMIGWVRSDRANGRGGVDPVSDRVSLAISSLSGHCLDLSRGLRARRVSHVTLR